MKNLTSIIMASVALIATIISVIYCIKLYRQYKHEGYKLSIVAGVSSAIWIVFSVILLLQIRQKTQQPQTCIKLQDAVGLCNDAIKHCQHKIDSLHLYNKQGQELLLKFDTLK